MNAFAAKLILACVVIAAIVAAWRYHGHIHYEAGKASVQKEWDADKAQRKAIADRQAADTIKLNQEHQDALNRTKTDLRDTRSNLAIALARLRDLPSLPGGEGMQMAGSGSAAVSSVADHPGRIGVTIPQRVGSCEGTGTDPCYTSREFFEQALGDAQDRRLTRLWADGQGIKTESAK